MIFEVDILRGEIQVQLTGKELPRDTVSQLITSMQGKLARRDWLVIFQQSLMAQG